MRAFGVNTPPELHEAATRLRAFDKKLPGQLRSLLRRVAQPIMKEQKRALMRLPADNGPVGPEGVVDMRRTVARGMKLRLRTGAGRHGAGPIFRISTTMPEKNLGMLPRGLDTSLGGWRSPLWGDRSRWVHHKTHGASWFLGPATDEKLKTRQQIVVLLKASASEIAIRARAR